MGNSRSQPDAEGSSATQDAGGSPAVQDAGGSTAMQNAEGGPQQQPSQEFQPQDIIDANKVWEVLPKISNVSPSL